MAEKAYTVLRMVHTRSATNNTSSHIPLTLPLLLAIADSLIVFKSVWQVDVHPYYVEGLQREMGLQVILAE